MEHKNNEQQRFDAVWARVTATHEAFLPDCTVNLNQPEESLSALIAAEAANGAYYAAVAGSLRHCDTAAFFRSLSNGCGKRLGTLQTLYFLLNGDSCPHKPTLAAPPKSPLMALREAYWRETHAAGALKNAAQQSDSAKLAQPLLELAEQSRQRSSKILQRIQRAMA